VQLSQLYVYPLKSARGIALREARLTARGLEHDRRFMLVDRDGVFLTQRQLPQMARLVTAIVGDALRVSWEGRHHEVALRPSQGERLPVRVFQDQVEALDQGAAARAFFSAALAQDARLVYLPDESPRPVDPTYAEAGEQVGFADGFPYLVANEGSLADLNERLEQPVPMQRFRPNLVVANAPAFAEDGWREIRIGDACFALRKPCTRCVIITTDQETGMRHAKEPLKTLAGYNTWQGKPAFAQNALLRSGERVQLGDSVAVLT
jgi:uncharacterized protein YcbX